MNLTSNDVFEGTFCLITKESSKNMVLFFFLFEFLLYIGLVVLIAFFYSKIIRKMVGYSVKQKILLSRMSSHTSRTGHGRQVPNDSQISFSKDEPPDDFSRDFSPNQISTDAGKASSGDKISDEEKNGFLNNGKPQNSALGIQISPPIVEENGEVEKQFLRQQAGSENNIHLLTTVHDPGNPLETNQLLIRRFKSSDDFNVNVSKLQILPPIDPYEAMFEPLFLHAPMTHKKKEKGSIRKSKKGKIKSISRSKSNVDISLRMVKPTKRDENARSLEGLATFYCGKNNNDINSNITNNMDNINNIQDGTLTLTRRTTPKGSKNCIIPISTTLSMKSAVSYNAYDPGENNENKRENTKSKSTGTDNNETLDSNNKIDKNIDKDNKYDQKVDPTDPTTDTDGPPVRRDTVSFKPVNKAHNSNNPIQVQMRKRSEKRNSEEILTPSPKQIDYRRRPSVRPIPTNRTSLILFWISLAFVISFLPLWIIVIVRTLIGPNMLADLSHVELGSISLFIRFPLISNAINPMIYGLMNSQFRRRCSNIFRWSKKGRRS